MTCITTTKTAKPMATLRARVRRPAVIIATKSRQARRDSWRANHTAVPACAVIPFPRAQERVVGRGWGWGEFWLAPSCRFRRKRGVGDECEEGIFQARS